MTLCHWHGLKKTLENMFEQLTSAIMRTLPNDVSEDLRANIKAALQAQLEKMGLVTREELEIKQAQLDKLRLQLSQLEASVSALETHRDKP